MEITASIVKELREQTGVGMMDCKTALTKSNGDFEAAIKYLREKGLAKAANKADRETKEGRIFTAIDANGKTGVIVEINCETDFVGKNDQFLGFGDDVTSAILSQNITNIDSLNSAVVNGKKMNECLSDMVFKLGENISIKQMDILKSAGRVCNYTHSNGKVAVLVSFEKDVDDQVAKDIAMHIAAMSPRYVSRDQVPAAELDAEKEIIRNQSINEGKPAAFADKIVEGRIQKFYKEICLVEQEFVKDPKQTVGALIPGNTITRFIRYSFN